MPLVCAMLAILPAIALAAQRDDPREPLFRTVDLDRGNSREVELADGATARVRLLDVEEDRDGVRSAIRQARVKVEVNGQVATLVETLQSTALEIPATSGDVSQASADSERSSGERCSPVEA